MIDFHSHILPDMDDGAKDVDMSLKMLEVCRETGVETVVLTSHCHPAEQEDIDEFLKKREASYKALLSAVKRQKLKLPKIIPASEIRIYKDMHKLSGFDKLCISGTEYILLEMPYEKWKDYAFEEIYQIKRLGFKPIMAHLDRFFDQSRLFGEIYSLNPLIQVNTSAFLEKGPKGKVLKMLEEGHLHILGSDTHNLDDRSPNLAKAYNLINSKLGEDYTDYIDYAGNAILENKTVKTAALPKINPFKKMFM